MSGKSVIDAKERRGLLATQSNPGSRLDYVSALDGRIASAGDAKPATVGVRYVPDKRILDPATFGRYLEALGTLGWASLEEVAVTILDDINNEVVTRWVQVAVSAPDGGHPGVDNHGVVLEDRQPSWDNPALLSRLRRY